MVKKKKGKITLYHGTKSKNIKSIKKHGLFAGRDGDVDLVNSKSYASTYGSNGYIIRVVVPVKLVKLDYSQYSEDKLIFATAKRIPKRYIKAIKKI